MGAFFFALIGLLCVAGGKTMDSVSKKLDEKNSADMQNRIDTEYRKLRLGYRVGSKELEDEFRKMTADELEELLSDDLYYITGEKKSKEYFEKALMHKNTGVTQGLILLWLSKNGVIPRDFGSYTGYASHLGGFSVYFEDLDKPVSTSILDNGFDNKAMIDTKMKALSLRTLKRIEYNLREKYTNLRFVFVPEKDYNGKKVTDIFKLKFHLLHELTYTSDCIFGWNASETNPGDEIPEQTEEDWNDMSSGKKALYIAKAFLYGMCIVAFGAMMYACNPD